MNEPSARQDRHRSGGRIANSLRTAGAKAKKMFFGASPTERRELRQTDERKTVKLDDLDMDALDRDKFGAPKKVGETISLIDVAMGKAPEPDKAIRPPPQALPTTRPMIIPPRPPGAPPPEQGAPPPLQVAPPKRRWGEKACAVLAVVAAALIFGARPLLREVEPALATEALYRRSLSVDPGLALDPWGQPWRARPGALVAGQARAPMIVYSSGKDGVDDRGANDDLPVGPPGVAGADPGVVTAAAWAPEVSLVLALGLAWLAVALRRTRADTAGCLGEVMLTAVVALAPAAAGGALIAWVGGLLTLPWPVPHGERVEAARDAISRAGGAETAAGVWAGVVLICVGALRMARRT